MLENQQEEQDEDIKEVIEDEARETKLDRENAGGSVKKETESWFPSQDTCLFCDGDASKEFIAKELKKNSKRRQLVTTVSHASTKVNLENKAKGRSDVLSKKILQRLSGIDSLIGAKYHRTCCTLFYGLDRILNSSTGQRGRKVSPSTATAFDKIDVILQRYPEDCHSAQDLINAVGCDVDIKTFKRKVLERNQLVLTNNPTLICTRGLLSQILLKSFNSSQIEDKPADEKDRLLVTAASIIRADVIAAIGEAAAIPPLELFLESDVPDSLKIFLTQILQDEDDNMDITEVIVPIAHAIFVAVHSSLKEESESYQPSSSK